jgi:bifunctional DNA-binding transcriptional regulator/antitoxin component of YhaV-PrlF toxin-antitoxin module
MTVTVKSKMPLVVPMAVRRKAGLKSGQEIEFRVSGGVINIVPKLPPADDECTPEQRRAIDAQLAEGLDDVKHGRIVGPFETHEEMIEFLHGQVKKAQSKPKRRKTA